MPTEGREVVLVDERQRIIAPVALRPEQRLSVTGRTPVYMVYDRDGRRLTTADGKNVGGALMVRGQPRELDRRE
jgi:hypothetical protein